MSFLEDSLFDFGSRQVNRATPCVMGIINVTPDSFSDGGELIDGDKISLSRVLRRAELMIGAGASILDVGGESTRPGAKAVSSQEEIDRVIPVVEALTREFETVVSVDTSNPQLMRICKGAGAGLINDVRALEREGALEAASESQLPVCLMHMQGQPETMQNDPEYHHVTTDVLRYLQFRVDACVRAGISSEKIILDPGFGFGKTLEHNLALLAGLDSLSDLDLPLLVGVSRKRMVGSITGKPEKERLAGSLAAAVIAVMKGAWIIRAHDVVETVDALKLCQSVQSIGRA